MTDAIRPLAQPSLIRTPAAGVLLSPARQSVLADNVADVVAAASNPARPSKPVEPAAQVALINDHLARELGIALSVIARGQHSFAVAVGGMPLGLVSTACVSTHRETFNANVIQQFATLLTATRGA